MHFDSFTIPEGGLQAMQKRKKSRKDSNKKEIRVQEKKTDIRFIFVSSTLAVSDERQWNPWLCKVIINQAMLINI